MIDDQELAYQEPEEITVDPEMPGEGMPFQKHPSIQNAIRGKDDILLAELSIGWYSKSLHHRMDIMVIGMAVAMSIGDRECWLATEGEFTYFFAGELESVVAHVGAVAPAWGEIIIPDGMPKC